MNWGSILFPNPSTIVTSALNRGARRGSVRRMYRLLARKLAVVPTATRLSHAPSYHAAAAAAARVSASSPTSTPTSMTHHALTRSSIKVVKAQSSTSSFSSRAAARRCPGSSARGGHARRYATGADAPVVDPGPPPPVALVSFTRAPHLGIELGVVENGQWLWSIPADKYPGGMTQLIGEWGEAGGQAGLCPVEALERERRGDPVPLASVTLHPPIPAPPSIVCVGKNYLEHVGEVDTNLPGGATVRHSTQSVHTFYTV